MGILTLLLGGARSGKSRIAQEMAEQYHGPVTYIATAQASDAEMAARIQAHQVNRPVHWHTLEAPRAVAAAWERQPDQTGLVVLDCLTLMVTNLILHASPDPDNVAESAAQIAVETEVEHLLEAIQTGAANWIVVSNEVGSGLVPPYPLGRIYRDLLGWANQRLAAAAREVYLLVAGIPVPLHPYRNGPPIFSSSGSE